MNDTRRIRILRATLDTILFEAKEPIIKAYAQSALAETVDVIEPVNFNIYCKKHNWYGSPSEKCPMCKTEDKF